MRTIGLLGGMSWESTVPYYRIVNETVRERLGGLHSAKLVLYSVDFQEIEHLQRAEAWDEAGQMLGLAARALQAAGADFIVLCTNTMHKVADSIERAAGLPLLHIADPTAEEIKAAGLHRIGLLGTRFTMEQDFYKARLRDQHGLDILIPGDSDREIMHRVIYDELCQGRVREESREHFRQIIQRLMDQGAQAIILGCTEISMLIDDGDSPVPTFDTTRLHARKAADWAVASGWPA